MKSKTLHQNLRHSNKFVKEMSLATLYQNFDELSNVGSFSRLL